MDMISGIGSSSPSPIGPAKDGVKVDAAGAAIAVSTTKTDKEMPMTLVAAIAELGPPVDTDKIQAIRQAIAQGRYPIDAKSIADKMIALDLPKVGR
ncbi:flagellar biosynthesis anti-sigma factor FlgM [Sphingomonas montanisoli]|uniref:Negative regulator of flagellin synthesis n=2 Tax=Sphingomonas montanisoli TaxID=2606412 RepID=A0A5D9C0Z3_9SPHN|nr:flagellar biosynthesis anti-sigma factor FlgM [Sphingomonas montanisoli]